MLDAAQVDCTGIHVGVLTIPSGVSAEDQTFLQGLGLQVARTVRIWPSGMMARGWDGEGRSEWLTTETPCFGIVHDHPVDAYSLRLDNGAEQIIAAGTVTHPTFIKLHALAPGRHMLAVKAQRTAFAYSTPMSPPAEGVVDLFVREPEPWIPGTTAYAGLAVTLDPQDPDLDTFWQGEVDVNVRGPHGHQVTCAITLINAGGQEILSEKIGAFNLPVTGPVWQHRFRQFANHGNRAWAYLEATSARFAVSADELGEYKLLLERDVRPVQWACLSAHKTATVRLIDDTGKDTTAACSFHSFAAPADALALTQESVLVGHTVTLPGGLFIARHGDVQDTVVVSTPQIEHGLRGLLIEPNLGALAPASTTLEAILDMLLLWRNARVVGPLAGVRRSRVVARLTNHFYERICGNRWARAEAAFFNNPDSETALRGLESAVGGQPGFRAVVRHDYEKMGSGLSAGIQWFAEVARRYSVCTDAELCRFALRMASEPEHFLSLSEPDHARAVRVMNDNETLFRGARLVAVLAAAWNQTCGPDIMPRWEWQ
jgi:hypothetical protein